MRFGLLLLTLSVISSTYAQLAVSNGATIHVSTGAVVYVNGGLSLSGSTGFLNDGQVTITRNSTFSLPGTITIGNQSQVSGDGQYLIEQDWMNNGTFNGGASSVTLYGDLQQFIGGLVPTVFNDLTLSGTGSGNDRKKTLQNVNASTGVNGTLTLSDRELETQINTFFVLNPSVNAVSFANTFGSEGFVSSVSPGTLSRLTNAASTYIFPTGSSDVTLRFRPVELIPQTNEASQYTVRFNNFDPNTQSFNRDQTDGLECALNPTYFHSIERLVGSAATDIRLFYVIATDGDWTGIAHWRMLDSDWNDMGTTASAVNGGFSTRMRAAWNFVNQGHPYILSTIRPETPVLNCTDVCEQSVGNVFTVNGNGTYQWTFPNNASLTSGQGTNAATVDWTTGTDTIFVIAEGPNGCNSLPATCVPTVNPSPSVQFTYTDNGSDFAFTDQTSGAASWFWSFGDGANDVIANPVHTYAGGTNFIVTLDVTDANGCSGSASQAIEIFEELRIPNIITPNNDGVNDDFLITASGLTSFDLVIVNRWGNKIFSTDDPTISWDGKMDGNPVADGVYFYVLKAKSATKEYNYQGNVTVVRN